MNTIDYHLLDASLQKKHPLKLKQLLTAGVLLLGLVALIINWGVKQNISHYQQLNAPLEAKLLQLTQRHSKISLAEITEQQNSLLNLLNLISHSVLTGIQLQQIYFNNDSLILKGNALNTELTKQWIQNLGPRFNLEDFEFEHAQTQGINFNSRFSFR